MRRRELDHFRSLIDRKMRQLLTQAGHTVGRMSSLDEHFPDPTDRANLESDRNFTLRIRDRERKLILKLKDALNRIEAGTYGYCEICGEPIPASRLTARPEATVCIDCKTEMEDRERLARTYR
ncbi:MAG: RNA polymerase-binding protein DksA [Myxococcales bacterium]|nr:MAG: RNA polymerase-binding protein DksA [Myxococcales bacterium]